MTGLAEVTTCLRTTVTAPPVRLKYPMANLSIRRGYCVSALFSLEKSAAAAMIAPRSIKRFDQGL